MNSDKKNQMTRSQGSNASPSTSTSLSHATGITVEQRASSTQEEQKSSESEQQLFHDTNIWGWNNFPVNGYREVRSQFHLFLDIFFLGIGYLLTYGLIKITYQSLFRKNASSNEKKLASASEHFLYLICPLVIQSALLNGLCGIATYIILKDLDLLKKISEIDAFSSAPVKMTLDPSQIGWIVSFALPMLLFLLSIITCSARGIIIYKMHPDGITEEEFTSYDGADNALTNLLARASNPITAILALLHALFFAILLPLTFIGLKLSKTDAPVIEEKDTMPPLPPPVSINHGYESQKSRFSDDPTSSDEEEKKTAQENGAPQGFLLSTTIDNVSIVSIDIEGSSQEMNA